MKIHHLPKYTAERFYLLSELEQKVHFIFLDELHDDDDVIATHVHHVDDEHDNANVNVKIGVDEDDVSILYLIWKAKDHDQKNSDSTVALREKLSGLVSHINPGHRCLIVIDWLISDEDSFDSVTIEISELLSWFHSVYTEAHKLVIGVSDSIRGVPGLEKCNDMIDTLIQSYPELIDKTAIVVKIYGINRDEFVGYESGLEPDAGSNVFQVLCYESEEDFKNGGNQLILQLFEMNDRVVAKLKSGSSIKLESTAMPQDIRCLFLFLIGVLIVLIAVALNAYAQISIIRNRK